MFIIIISFVVKNFLKYLCDFYINLLVPFLIREGGGDPPLGALYPCIAVRPMVFWLVQISLDFQN